MEALAPYQPYVIWALAALVLLLLVVLVLRALSGRVRARQGSRLGISEYQEIDKQRRLVLVRRDGVEHLVMIGGANELVIETGIGAPARAHGFGQRVAEEAPPFVAEPRQVPVPEQVESPPTRTVVLRAAPRPPVFGDRASEAAAKQRAEPRLEPVKKEEESES
jgi:hypothetical protein